MLYVKTISVLAPISMSADGYADFLPAQETELLVAVLPRYAEMDMGWLTSSLD